MFCIQTALAKFLYEHETHLCGTVKSSRKNYAKALIDVDLQRGTAVFSKPVDNTPYSM